MKIEKERNADDGKTKGKTYKCNFRTNQFIFEGKKTKTKSQTKCENN